MTWIYGLIVVVLWLSTGAVCHWIYCWAEGDFMFLGDTLQVSVIGPVYILILAAYFFDRLKKKIRKLDDDYEDVVIWRPKK